jgi:acyl-CoA thioesterase I
MEFNTGWIVLAALSAVLTAGFGLLWFLLANPIPPRVSKKGIRVACVGDSITYGAGVALRRSRDSFPDQLGKMLGSEYQVLNYGVSSATLLKSGNRPYWKTDFFLQTQKINPAIVTIMLGTNDTKPQNWNAKDYTAQMVELINLYKNLPGHPAIVLLTPPAAIRSGGKDNLYGVRNDIIKNEVLPILLRVGEHTNTPVVDIFAVTREHPEFFPDGVHPTAAGNKAIAETVYMVISQ